jgi:hypothetical protein
MSRPSTTRIAKALAAVALSTASLLALAGPVSAVTYDAGRIDNTQTMSRDDGSYAAPTANLEKLRQNMRVASNSINGSLHFDAGLISSTARVTITATFGSNSPKTQTYSAAYGNHFLQTFGVGDGQARNELIAITMVEQVNSKSSVSYSTSRSITIRPLYDVAISPLRFTLLSDCDWVGDSEIRFFFSHSGAWGTLDFSMSKNQTHTVNTYFNQSWSGVGVSNDLRVPLVSFWEDDPGGATLGGSSPQPLSDERILPGYTRSYDWVQGESGGQCSARIQYSISVTLLAPYV